MSPEPSKPPPQIFDRKLYLARRKKANRDLQTLLEDHIVPDLMDRLSVVRRTFESLLLISSHDSGLMARLAAAGHGSVVRKSPSESDDLGLPAAQFDLAISYLDLQAVNDAPGYLIQLNQALKPDGLLLAVSFAGETLHELRDVWLEAEVELTGGATPRVAPMIGVREIGSLLQRAGFALPVTDSDRMTLRYDNAFALMTEIKIAGFANPLIGRSNRFVSRRMLGKVAEIYQQRFADLDSRIRTTIDITWVQAWKPHPSQQQPLKPGSAKARLADALKVPEAKI